MEIGDQKTERPFLPIMNYISREEETEVLQRRSVLHLRNTPHKTTERSPAELQVGKRLPTLLDRTKPDLSIKRDIEIWKQKMYQHRKSKNREFRIGEESPGIIDHQTAELSYEVLVAGERKRKHADQLTKRNGAMDEPNRSEENDTSSSCKRYIPEKWQDYIILPTQKKVGNLKNLQIILKI
ncbi:hypothetical protein T03_8002, partial [Trichinella britovi]